MKDKITVEGAKEHNLKDIDLEMPRNKMIVVTGLSGSGKTSLAFDTIFAEGQRRYVESLSAYARQFLGSMQKPDVDEIKGLSPGISIDQKSRGANPRSTVATITEIYDYLRVLFARVGTPYSPKSGKELQKMTTDEITETILEQMNVSEESELKILAPLIQGRKGEYYQLMYDLYNDGFLEIRVDGEFKSLREKIVLDKNKKHTIEVVMDKIQIDPDKDKDSYLERIVEAVEEGIDLADGTITTIYDDGKEEKYSTEYVLPEQGTAFPEVEPRLFSFNSPYGYCEACSGLGVEHRKSEKICEECGGKRLNEYALSVRIKDKNIHEVTTMHIGDAYGFFEGLEEEMSEKELEISKAALRETRNRLKFMNDVGLHYLTLDRKAGTLSGGESQRIRLASQVGQQLVGAMYVLDEPTIGLHQRDNAQLIKTLRDLCDDGNTIIIVEHDQETITSSDWVADLGPAAGKNGGEIMFSGRKQKLLNPDQEDLDNFGCETQGDPKESLTGKYLRGEKKIENPTSQRKVDSATNKLTAKGAKENNLKDIDIDIPLRRFVGLTGVSGSGKSTVMENILHRAAANELHGAEHKVGEHDDIIGLDHVSKVKMIDQSGIGRTPRSTPATYTKAFDYIRDLYASMTEAKVRGYDKGRFSFNKKEGRCENCGGKGEIKVEMHFLPSVSITCDVCGGARYNKETLQVHYKDKNIAEVLNMTVAEAEQFFKDIPKINDRLSILNDVGLDYLTLGQPSPTLSGGEAQRIKLAKELAKRRTTKALYLLDEPTTGLHYEDVKKLIKVLQQLVSKGNTVMVIEHNLELIKCTDWIIDLGPEGGENGGEIVKAGPPERIASYADSYTGNYLRKHL